MTEREIFMAALEKQDPTDRKAYVEQACADDPQLLSRVSALLEEHENLGSYLESPAHRLGPTERQLTRDDDKGGRVAKSKRLGDFEIIREIGRGGMGVVYEARQLSLNRSVALKVLPGALTISKTALSRFRREAEAAAKLHHTNIVPVYFTGETDGTYYYAMELVDGPSLDQVIRQIQRPEGKQSEASSHAVDPLALTEAHASSVDDSESKTSQTSWLSTSGGEYFDTAAGMIADVAAALDYAHQQGVIHRDIKPANLIQGLDGRLRIMDFGLAKLLDEPSVTASGDFLGTPRYMSPEQIAAGRVGIDQRTDVYSLGATLYELLTSQHLYSGQHREEVIAKILSKEPTRPRRLNRKVPVDLETICLKALEKDPDKRYQTAGQMEQDLRRYLTRFAISAKRIGPLGRLGKFVRRNRIGVTAAVIVVLSAAMAGLAGWKYREGQKELRAEQRVLENQKWAREEALPKVRRLADTGKLLSAFILAEKVEQYIPKDPTLQELSAMITTTVTIRSTPPGARVQIGALNAYDKDWLSLEGRTPLKEIRLPKCALRWKVTLDGHVDLEFVRIPRQEMLFRMERHGGIRPGMVRVAGETLTLALSGLERTGTESGDYLIDQYEVSNAQFQRFVNKGGYSETNADCWRHLIAAVGSDEWTSVLRTFVDKTGRPGPATWENGRYPAGESGCPVRGVSWYEAAAFAESVQKCLPTVYHWSTAASTRTAAAIAPFSNLDSSLPAPSPIPAGLGPFGTYDMFGNVKEWCWNQGAVGSRYVLGGAWNEPYYLALIADVQSPLSRLETHGFRCVAYEPDSQPAEHLLGEVTYRLRDPSSEEPVSDIVFESWRSMFFYAKSDLNDRILSEETTNGWVHVTVEFDTVYNEDRMAVHLFLPKRVAPPYQTVIYFPGASAYYRDEFELSPWMRQLIASVVESGRAFVWPIYNNTYERRRGLNVIELRRTRPNDYRDYVFQLSYDLGRSIDYLETRDDIESGSLGYLGFSWGANVGFILVAMENRLRAAVFASGGLYTKPALPQADQFNYVSRIRIPVLMLNGRYDLGNPVKAETEFMYQQLGSSDKDLKLFDSGHAVPRAAICEHSIEWFDSHLGR